MPKCMGKLKATSGRNSYSTWYVLSHKWVLALNQRTTILQATTLEKQGKP